MTTYSEEPVRRSKFRLVELLVSCGVVLVLMVLLGGAGLYGVTWQLFQSRTENASSARAHNLAIASFSYAEDNNGIYPFGRTSTDIFQKLYDGKYLTQPGDVLLVAGWTKSPATAAEGEPIRLKAYNVSYDYTTRAETGLTKDDPPDMPLVFSCVATGPGPNYQPGVNFATLDYLCPYGTDGMVCATLNQVAFFRRPTESNKVPLTHDSFAPPKGVTYVMRTP